MPFRMMKRCCPAHRRSRPRPQVPRTTTPAPQRAIAGRHPLRERNVNFVDAGPECIGPFECGRHVRIPRLTCRHQKHGALFPDSGVTTKLQRAARSPVAFREEEDRSSIKDLGCQGAWSDDKDVDSSCGGEFGRPSPAREPHSHPQKSKGV